jgi:diguanylate cyclase (GGDEF)-like protein
MSDRTPLRRRTDAAPAEPIPLNALIVDDDEPYRSYVAAVVRRFGFKVSTAVDGLHAVDALHGSTHFDLLIIDCEMPKMSGLDLIAEVRRHEQGRDIYALMLTAHEDTETKIRALQLGFDDFLSKSLTDSELVAKLGAARRLIARQRRLYEEMHQLYGLATQDELTGLFNRRFLFSEIERMLGEGTSVNIIFFDLDDFKSVNDTYGHLAGDRILRDLGTLFLRQTRHDDVIARYGGDEFVLLTHDLSPEEVEKLATRLALQVGDLAWNFGQGDFHVRCTSGVACSSLLTDPAVGKLLNAGDRDLYKNKWIHRNPGLDPALYEYPEAREAEIREFPSPKDVHKVMNDE